MTNGARECPCSLTPTHTISSLGHNSRELKKGLCSVSGMLDTERCVRRMAMRNILHENDSGLFKKSRAVTDFNKRLHVLLDDMRETLVEANGLGLAAPQVGILRRAVIIVDTSIEIAEDASFEEQIVELINPEIIARSGEQSGSEGCLSVPGVYGLVKRPDFVKVKAHDRHGNEFELWGKGLTARAICHEVDHLDGVMFTALAERFLTEEEIEKLQQEQEENECSGELRVES